MLRSLAALALLAPSPAAACPACRGAVEAAVLTELLPNALSAAAPFVVLALLAGPLVRGVCGRRP